MQSICTQGMCLKYLLLSLPLSLLSYFFSTIDGNSLPQFTPFLPNKFKKSNVKKLKILSLKQKLYHPNTDVVGFCAFLILFSNSEKEGQVKSQISSHFPTN